MAAGDLTVTLVGTYATVAALVAAMDAANLPAATDYLEIIQTPGGSGTASFSLIKVVRAAA